MSSPLVYSSRFEREPIIGADEQFWQLSRVITLSMTECGFPDVLFPAGNMNQNISILIDKVNNEMHNRSNAIILFLYF